MEKGGNDCSSSSTFRSGSSAASSDGISTSDECGSKLTSDTSISNQTGYSPRQEGFKFSSVDVTLDEGAGTCSNSAISQNHENKTCTQVTNTASNDGNDSPFSNSKTINNAVIKIEFPRLRATWTCSNSVAPYFEQLIYAYKSKYFTYVYEHLEGSRLVVLINKELARFFCNELKNRKSKGIIWALHGIHSLSLNPLSDHKVITKVLFHDKFFSSVFDPIYHYNYGSFCFLAKEILVDIISELFRKTASKVWFLKYLDVLKKICLKCFGVDCEISPNAPFLAIAAYLVIGIEALPSYFYPSLNYYFASMFRIVSRNNLSIDCLEKVWEELLLFYDHWVKYSLCHPFLDCVDPSDSTTQFEIREEPVKKVTGNEYSVFDNVYIRNRMKYEYVHVEDGYVPCEYPSVPSYPRLPKSYPTLEEMEESGTFWSFLDNQEVVTEELLGIGYCEECKESSCSCVDDYIEAWEKQQSESNMNVDELSGNVSSDEQIKLVSSEEQLPEPMDVVHEDMTPEELNEYYEYLIKDSTRSVSVYESEARKAWKNIRIPDLSNLFSDTAPVLSDETTAASDDSSVLSDGAQKEEIIVP